MLTGKKSKLSTPPTSHYHFGIITLFPEMFQALDWGITGRALKDGLLRLQCWNPRDFTQNKHKTVDDKPYGGGPGMLMRVEPLSRAITAAKAALPANTPVIYLSPQGKPFQQAMGKEILQKQSYLFIAGRYEGIDERLIEQYVDEEWSIGDYVLSGGELAAMVIIDAMTRHIPGVVGDQNSVNFDSLSEGLLKYPQYTRPEKVAGLEVPEVLLSGHHKDIEKWRLKQSLGKTWLKRPDLLALKTLSPEEKQALAEFIEDFKKQNS